MVLYRQKMTISKYKQRIIEWWKSTSQKSEADSIGVRKEKEKPSELENSLGKREHKFSQPSEIHDWRKESANDNCSIQNKKICIVT